MSGLPDGGGLSATADEITDAVTRAVALAQKSPGWQSTIAGSHGRRDYILRRALAGVDMLAITIALGIAFATSPIRNGSDVVWVLPALPVMVAVFGLYGLYTRDTKRISQNALDDLPWVFHALIIGALFLWAYFHLLPVHRLVFQEVLIYGVLGAGLILALRFVARRATSRLLGAERVLLVGDSPVSSALVRKMSDHPEYALNPVGVIICDGARSTKSDLPVMGKLGDDLAAVLKRHDIERVVVAQEEVGDELMLRLLNECGRLYVKISVLPKGVDAMGPSMEVDDIEGLTVLGLNPLVMSRSSRSLKRAMDVLGATTGLIVLFPVMLVAAIAIKLDSRGPVLFRQPRAGRSGDLFSLLKLRTMVVGAEARAAELMRESSDPNWLKLEQDPRITRAGRLLRLTSIDEVPQLWNVLVGQMSLVGPRPLTAADHFQVERWGEIRLDLAPGITGLWQVLGRGGIPFEEMVKLDYVYVTNWSLWTDIKLLLRTVPAVAQRRGAN